MPPTPPCAATHAQPASTSPPDPQPDAPTPGIRVLCVDDHAVLIEGLKAQFGIDGRIGVVGQLGSADGLLDGVARLDPDVVLLDIEMPGPDAFEMADRLRHLHPRTRVVFLSAHIRDGYIAAAYRCGASGYFSKSDDLEAIAAGVTKVAQSRAGTFVLGPKVEQRCRPQTSGHGPARAAGSEPAPRRTPLESLTAREVEILRLIGKGRSRTQIAAELARSPKTIDGHQERMMKKLDIHTRSDLLRLAIREGLAEA